MSLCQVVVSAFLLSLVVSGSYAYDYGKYGSEVEKVIVYGQNKVVLPTIKNILIVYEQLIEKSLKYIPKELRYELESLVKKLDYFNVNSKKLISQAEKIIKIIEKGYIKDCDYLPELKESLYLLIVVLKSCSDDYTYNYHR